MKKIIVKFDKNYSVRYEIGMQADKLVLREYAICPFDKNVLSSNRYINLYCIEYSDDGVVFFARGNFKKQEISGVFFNHINDRVNISNFKIPKVSGAIEIQYLEENINPRFTIDNDLINLFIYYTHAVKNFAFLELVEGLSEENVLTCRFKYKNMPEPFLSSLKEFKLFLVEKAQQIEKIFRYESRAMKQEEFDGTPSESSNTSVSTNSQNISNLSSFFKTNTLIVDPVVNLGNFVVANTQQEECLIL